MMSKEKNATPSHGPKLKEGDFVSSEHHGVIVHGQVEWERAGVVNVLIKTQDSFISHEPPQYIKLHRTMVSLVGQEEPEISEDEEEHNQQQDPSTQTTPSTEIGTRMTSSTGTGAESRANNLERLIPLEGQEEVEGFRIGKRVTVHDCGEGLIHWMAYTAEGRLMLGLEMDKPSHSYNTRLFGVTLPYQCDLRRAHIISSHACSVLSQSASVEDGPYTLSAEELKRFKIQKCQGTKELVEGQPGKGTVRWIGYLPGEAHLTVGYEMDKTKSFYTNGNHGSWQVFSCRKNTGFFQMLHRDRPHQSDRSVRIPVHHQQPTHVDLPEVHKTITSRTQTASTSKPAPPQQVPPQSLTPAQHKLDFSVGDVVLLKGKGNKGTVCWIGYHEDRKRIMVGLDMMEDKPNYNFGYLHRYKLFDTGGRRSSLFVTAQSCTKPVKKSEEEAPNPLRAADFELEYDIDSRVELDDGKKGTVKWIGQYRGSLVVGLVMDEANAHKYNSGQLGDHQVFDGPNHRCYIASCEQVKIVFEPGIEHPIPLESNIWGLKYENNSHVELEDGGKGVVRWIGQYGNQRMVGLEMDEADKEKYHHGFLGEHQVFTGPDHRCHFVRCDQVKIIPDHPDQGGPDALDSDDPFPVEMIAADMHLDYNIDDIVRIKSSDRLGKVRWIGNFKGKDLIGLEMNEARPEYGTDGTLGNYEVFKCEGKKSLFIECHECCSIKKHDQHGTTNQGEVDSHKQQQAEIQDVPGSTTAPKEQQISRNSVDRPVSFSSSDVDNTLRRETSQEAAPGSELNNSDEELNEMMEHLEISVGNEATSRQRPQSPVVRPQKEPQIKEDLTGTKNTLLEAIESNTLVTTRSSINTGRGAALTNMQCPSQLLGNRIGSTVPDGRKQKEPYGNSNRIGSTVPDGRKQKEPYGDRNCSKNAGTAQIDVSRGKEGLNSDSASGIFGSSPVRPKDKVYQDKGVGKYETISPIINSRGDGRNSNPPVTSLQRRVVASNHFSAESQELFSNTGPHPRPESSAMTPGEELDAVERPLRRNNCHQSQTDDTSRGGKESSDAEISPSLDHKPSDVSASTKSTGCPSWDHKPSDVLASTKSIDRQVSDRRHQVTAMSDELGQRQRTSPKSYASPAREDQAAEAHKQPGTGPGVPGSYLKGTQMSPRPHTYSLNEENHDEDSSANPLSTMLLDSVADLPCSSSVSYSPPQSKFSFPVGQEGKNRDSQPRSPAHTSGNSVADPRKPERDESMRSRRHKEHSGRDTEQNNERPKRPSEEWGDELTEARTSKSARLDLDNSSSPGDPAVPVKEKQKRYHNETQPQPENSQIQSETDKFFSSDAGIHLEKEVMKESNDSTNRVPHSVEVVARKGGEGIEEFIQNVKSGNLLTGEEAAENIDGTKPKTKPVHAYPSPARKHEPPQSVSPAELGTDLEIGSIVQLKNHADQYVIVKWLGLVSEKKMVGLEMEKENPSGCDGSFLGHKLFDCPPGRGLVLRLENVIKRFGSTGSSVASTSQASNWPALSGHHSQKSERVYERVPPTKRDVCLEKICGRWKGIQGHYNSCYLDSTIYAMFAFCDIFDEHLERSSQAKRDIEAHTQIQELLRHDIVYPLRRDHYVDADKVLQLREVLDTIGPLKGLTTQEKDPEEFLKCLLEEALQCPPFLRFNNDNDTHYYQVFLDEKPPIKLPTTQQLVELSFFQANIKLNVVPPCFFVQMPRFGKAFRLYEKIIPSLELDITDILTKSYRECQNCGKPGVYECRDCFGHDCGDNYSLQYIVFCEECVARWHQHKKRQGHKPTRLEENYSNSFRPTSRTKMELVAVICIQTSHYVSFVRAGEGRDAPWLFFDSMADRIGYEDGFNVPEVTQLDDFLFWLSKDGQKAILRGSPIPEKIQRLLGDGYMSIYRPLTR